MRWKAISIVLDRRSSSIVASISIVDSMGIRRLTSSSFVDIRSIRGKLVDIRLVPHVVILIVVDHRWKIVDRSSISISISIVDLDPSIARSSMISIDHSIVDRPVKFVRYSFVVQFDGSVVPLSFVNSSIDRSSIVDRSIDRSMMIDFSRSIVDRSSRRRR